MRYLWIWLLAILFSIGGMIYFPQDTSSFGKNLYEVSLMVLALATSFALNVIFNNRNYFLLYLKSFFALNRNNSIRVSFSYLFRISVKDKFGKYKFLLVRNTNMENQLAFQPVGGVYKYFDKSFLNSIGAIDAENFHQKGDLRIKIPKKNLYKVLTWFDNKKDRETTNFREFYEELIGTNILLTKEFPWINSRFLSAKNSGFRNSEFFECEEIVFYDIFELMPNEIQRVSLKKLLEVENENFIWADEKFIRRKGFDTKINKDTCKICEHTIQIF